jgi:hypothetical protein
MFSILPRKPKAHHSKHAPGVKVGNDAAPESHPQTLPAGAAPSDRTFSPQTQSDIPGQAMNPNISKETWTSALECVQICPHFFFILDAELSRNRLGLKRKLRGRFLFKEQGVSDHYIFTSTRTVKNYTNSSTALLVVLHLLMSTLDTDILGLEKRVINCMVMDVSKIAGSLALTPIKVTQFEKEVKILISQKKPKARADSGGEVECSWG